MRKATFAILVTGLISFIGTLFVWDAKVNAQEILRYSCSAQAYKAFEKDRIEMFTKARGIKVDLFVASSDTSLNRLKHGFCDIASSVRKLDRLDREQGYVETTFCRDPLSLIHI